MLEGIAALICGPVCMALPIANADETKTVGYLADTSTREGENTLVFKAGIDTEDST